MSNLDRAIYAFQRRALVWLVDERTGEIHPESYESYYDRTIAELQHYYVRLEYAAALAISAKLRARS